MQIENILKKIRRKRQRSEWNFTHSTVVYEEDRIQ